jgi:signal transduction histidine kinase
MRAVLENLLGNAVKYTGKTDQPRIEFGAVAVDGGLEFHIRDNGAGFDMAYADKLFQPFQRLHSEREFEGTGVGLATVARIVQRHGGRVRAISVPKQGSTFFIVMPKGEVQT